MPGETVLTRLRHGWNAFRNRDPTRELEDSVNFGYTSSRRPDRFRFHMGTEKSVISAMYNRIAIDAASVRMEHVRLDQNGRYLETNRTSTLNERLTLDANIDQTGRALMQDIYMSLFDEGTVAVVPVEATLDPMVSGSYEILSLRTARIVDWRPLHVRVELYNEDLGVMEEVVYAKKSVAIIENPFYAVMNEKNSTLQRLIRKLNLLDAVDEQSGSGKLDIIIQFPFAIKTDIRRKQAEERRSAIEAQLTNSKYGIAYADATERITQLNRPADNNLMAQIQYLTSMLFSQLGLTEAIFMGTADEEEKINYWTRSIEPLLATIRDEFTRKFLTKTARTQGQAIMYFRDAFMLVPAEQLAELADKFTRNEILSPNEVRAELGRAPSGDPKSDELRNRNINPGNDQTAPTIENEGVVQQKGARLNGSRNKKEA